MILYSGKRNPKKLRVLPQSNILSSFTITKSRTNYPIAILHANTVRGYKHNPIYVKKTERSFEFKKSILGIELTDKMGLKSGVIEKKAGSKWS